MRLVVGLGNPGLRYAATRHNIGFRIASELRQCLRLPRFEVAGFSELSRGRFGDEDLVIARPRTYMNRSGIAVRELVTAIDVELSRMLVIVDDIYQPLGRLRFRRAGGDGGHNGLKSIIEETGGDSFPRLRVGVGEPPDGADLADFVLDVFESEDVERAARVEQATVDAVRVFLEDGIEAAMNRFNATPVVEEPENGS